MKEMGENNEKYTFRERKKFGLESLLLNMKTNQTNGRISYEKFLQRTPGGTQTWLQTFQIVEKEGGWSWRYASPWIRKRTDVIPTTSRNENVGMWKRLKSDHFLGRMRFAENLPWNLTKVVNEPDHGTTLHRIVDGIDVHISFVKEVVKDVGCLYRRLSTLFVAEDEVYPVV